MAAISGSFGAAIMLYDIQATPDSINFTTTSEFFTWVFINTIIFALYPILAVPLWKNVLGYKRYFKREVILAALVAVVLTALPDSLAILYLPLTKQISLAHAAYKIVIIMGIGMFSVMLPAIITVWLIQIAMHEDFEGTQFDNSHIERYVRLRDDLALMILILGSIIGLLTIAAAALRKAGIASQDISPDSYPLLYVSLYGAYFTFLLSLVYFPVYLSLNAVGNKICNSIFNLPSPNSSKWSDTYSKRKNLQVLLQLSSTDLQNWQSSLAILAPFIGGVISSLFEK